MISPFDVVDEFYSTTRYNLFSRVTKTRRPVVWYAEQNGRTDRVSTKLMMQFIDDQLRSWGMDDPSHGTVYAVLERLDSDPRFRVPPSRRRDFRAELEALFEFDPQAKCPTTVARSLISRHLTDADTVLDWIKSQGHYSDTARVRHDGIPVRAYIGFKVRTAPVASAPVLKLVETKTVEPTGVANDVVEFPNRAAAQRTYQAQIAQLLKAKRAQRHRAQLYRLVATLFAYRFVLKPSAEIEADVRRILQIREIDSFTISRLVQIGKDQARDHRFMTAVSTWGATG